MSNVKPERLAAHAIGPLKNRLGTIGFVSSLTGFFVLAALTISYASGASFVVDRSAMALIACGVLSPFGLILSAAGVFRVPKTLATAGVLFGLLGTLYLAGAGVLLIADEWELFTPPEELEQRRYEKTIAAVRKATERIQTRIKQYGNAPEDEEGNGILAGIKDGWGNSVKYLRRGEKRFLITSAGSDGEYGNDDDITNDTLARQADESAFTPDN